MTSSPAVYTVRDAEGTAIGTTTVFPESPTCNPQTTSANPPSAVDVDFSQADLPDRLKACMSGHFKPPFPFETVAENSARNAAYAPLTAYVALQPTKEQLQRLSLEEGLRGESESVNMEPSALNRLGNSTGLIVSGNIINTSIDDTCNAFAVYHTPGFGWTIREGPIRFGLQVDPSGITELHKHYSDLKWFRDGGLSEITLSLKRPSEDGRSGLRTGGDHEHQAMPPGMSRREETEVALTDFVSAYGTTQEQASSGFDHSRPSIPLFGYSDAAPRSEIINPTNPGKGSTLQLTAGCLLRGRMPDGQAPVFSRSMSSPDVDLSARFTCVLPPPGS